MAGLPPEALLTAMAELDSLIDLVRLESLPPHWQRRIRERATESRPAVLSPPVREGLAELLAFRHVVRHLSAYELDADRVRLLLQRAERMMRERSDFASVSGQLQSVLWNEDSSPDSYWHEQHMHSL